MCGGEGGGGRRGLRGFRSGCIEISLEVAETLGFGFIGRVPPTEGVWLQRLYNTIIASLSAEGFL